MAGRNPEEPDPLERIIDLYTDSETAPNVADQVRAQPVEGIAFAIGAAMGPISNARRLFADREWTTAELMRMERDMNECINWASEFRQMIHTREGK